MQASAFPAACRGVSEQFNKVLLFFTCGSVLAACCGDLQHAGEGISRGLPRGASIRDKPGEPRGRGSLFGLRDYLVGPKSGDYLTLK